MKIVGILCIIFLCSTQFVKAQDVHCRQINDTFFISWVRIASEKSYPVLMIGVSKNYNTSTFSNDSLQSFLRDFYTENQYSSGATVSYDRSIKMCPLIDDEGKYNKPYQGNNIDIQIDIHATRQIGSLKTGEIVEISTTKVSGKFWEFIGINIQNIFATSMERPLTSFNIELDKCYVPFHIDKYLKIDCKLTPIAKWLHYRNNAR